MADAATLLRARFGAAAPPAPESLPDPLVALIDRRVTRRYRPDPVPDALLDAVLAAAQSAPSKSDLQQYSIVVLRDPDRIATIADWIGTMPWIKDAPVFLVFCGDMRRAQAICARHGAQHANNTLDTFLNTAVDAALAMGHAMMAADAAGLGTCPISHVRYHLDKVAPLLGLPDGVYPVAGLTLGWPVQRRAVSMRLPPRAVIHRERYDTAADEAIAGYDEARERAEAASAPPGAQKPPPRWSENAARQLSAPEAAGFAAWLRTRGFNLG